MLRHITLIFNRYVYGQASFTQVLNGRVVGNLYFDHAVIDSSWFLSTFPAYFTRQLFLDGCTKGYDSADPGFSFTRQ